MDQSKESSVTSLVETSPPRVPSYNLSADKVEYYVRSAIHHDRTPGNLLVVYHPARLYKFPLGILDALEKEGFSVTRVSTEADRLESVTHIRDALKKLSSQGSSLDLLVVTGDGSLDHHVLIAAFWAFYPDMVTYRAGSIDCGAVRPEDLAQLPETYRSAFFSVMPDTSSLDPSEETIKQVWLMRSELEPLLRKRRSVKKICNETVRQATDPLLSVAILATLFPDKVVLRPHGFDLTGLADATQDHTFRGLYPFLRSVCIYPAGTAADNAVFSGVPGWGYGLIAGLLSKIAPLRPLKRKLEERLTRKFLRYYLHDSAVVPARLSVVGFDGNWQLISSHVAGGPGAGHFFSADLTSKTKGLSGYLKRIPKVVIQEGCFGSTVVRLRSRYASGAEKSFAEAQIAEALYTNRTYIAGIASIPTTNPTSFAGQSSLIIIPPIWYRDAAGQRVFNLRGLAGFTEAIFKGIAARIMRALGLGVGTWAGGGRFIFLAPEHQVAIKEGETIEIDYMTSERKPKAIGIQVSGDPFQAYRMRIRMVWGPLPMLGSNNSLLLAATRRSLDVLRLQQSYQLQGEYIGGIRYFVHHNGEAWSSEFEANTGLVQPPNHLPLGLPYAQRVFIEAWQQKGTGEFVDTTKSGLGVLRRGRYAHNSDQTAHLLILKEPPLGTLLVRQVRAMGKKRDDIYEARTYYRWTGLSYVIQRSLTMVWHNEDHPRILQDDQYFRNAAAFQQQAPSFFPVVARLPSTPTLLTREVGREEEDAEREVGRTSRRKKLGSRLKGGGDS